MNSKNWITRFDGLATLPAGIQHRLVSQSRTVSVPAGTVIFGPGKSPENLLLLLDGVVRVQQTSDNGREIVLYRVEAGQSCVLTTACMLAHEQYSAEGIAETDVEAVVIPRETFDGLVADSREFREFVFSAYGRRITDLFHVIDDVAFGQIDIRLAGRLLALARGGNDIQTTHQQLATELGTAREVISRQLQDFQRRGWVSQARGRITLQDSGALETLSESA